MPKPPLFPRDAVLQSQIIETMLAGLKRFRPDLDYPESHSDMEACVRPLMAMFEVKRRPIMEPLKVPCDTCNGSKLIPYEFHQDGSPAALNTCTKCDGSGHEKYFAN